MPVRIAHLGPGDDAAVLTSVDIFDEPPTPEWTARFLAAEDHHLLAAFEGDVVVGFVSGVETTHPDKGTEMFLYELGVHEDHRRRGTARALVTALADLARERGCYGMWVGVDPDNEAALATYRSAGAETPEPAVIITWSFAPEPAAAAGAATAGAIKE
jgi:ribosomal protein S18 acetylase RimI-like enzyme